MALLVNLWLGFPFFMALIGGVLTNIPPEYYEAARIDGAGRWRTTISITIPLIRDNVQTAYIYIGIMALDLFVFVQAMTPTGGPDSSTLVMSQQLIRTAFTEGKAGYASAMGVAMAVVTLLYAAVVFTVNRLTGGKDEKGVS